MEELISSVKLLAGQIYVERGNFKLLIVYQARDGKTLRFVGSARTMFPSMAMWYLIIAITRTSFWIGRIMSVVLLENIPIIAHNLSNNDLH